LKELMTGNEALARGAWEAGITVASAYPGTPSTEILENIALYDDIYGEWAPNEKVALEVAIGASIAGARSLAAMKHVGLNVAADPLFTNTYTGVRGGLVIVTADDPGMHSSQNEQDNRNYAKFAKIPMLEPSDSQEAKDAVLEAMKISETFDTPVLLRVTTRVCHSKGLVQLGEKAQVPIKEYKKDIRKYVATPANARPLHVKVEERLKLLARYSEETPLNRIEWGDKKVGIIASGIAYQYAKEVFGDKASYFKLGFSYPLPMNKIRDFASQVEELYVIEELDPFIEAQLKAEGIPCIGKERIPITGELNPSIVAQALLGEDVPTAEYQGEGAIPRPPAMCPGCPHRGVFYLLSRKRNIIVTGDIGCYTLASAEPLSAMDTCICMGASISAGHGANKAFEMNQVEKKVFAVIGDSTFFHSGITGLMNVIYNKGNVTTIILDNRITGMTGHQENPGTGYTLKGESTALIDIEKLCQGLGVKKIRTVNPLDLSETGEAIDEAMKTTEPMVIIAKWPCVLKKLRPEELGPYALPKRTFQVLAEKCTGCQACLRTGCPAIALHEGKAQIDESLCTGCNLCQQVCKFQAIEAREER
jgi:indolepyruvate ferredoxin oxidoreductase alpha subunit